MLSRTSISSVSEPRNWFLIDAKGATLGRLASRVSIILRGKHKANYTPYLNCGDNVVVVNAAQISISGNKLVQEKFYWHTGYPGGIKEKSWKVILNSRFPERLLIKAIERMMPKESPLARRQMRMLHVYPLSEHKHIAQEPQLIKV